MDDIRIGTRIRHSAFGEGIIFDFNDRVARVFFRDEDREIARSFKGMEVLAHPVLK